MPQLHEQLIISCGALSGGDRAKRAVDAGFAGGGLRRQCGPIAPECAGRSFLHKWACGEMHRLTARNIACSVAAGLLLLPYHLGRATTYVLLGAALAAPIGLGLKLADYRWAPALMLFLAAALFLWQALRSWGILPAGRSGAFGGIAQFGRAALCASGRVARLCAWRRLGIPPLRPAVLGPGRRGGDRRSPRGRDRDARLRPRNYADADRHRDPGAGGGGHLAAVWRRRPCPSSPRSTPWSWCSWDCASGDWSKPPDSWPIRPASRACGGVETVRQFKHCAAHS